MTFRLMLCLFFAFFLAACASVPSTSVEENISVRVKARWNALIEHKWSDAYQYETLGYQESHTLEQFKSKFGRAVSWQKVMVSKVLLDESKTNATVTVNVAFNMMLPGQGLQNSTANLTETWLLDSGVWLHYTK